MIDRIVISLFIGLVGGIVIWSGAVLVLWLNTMVPWYYMLSSAAIIAFAAFLVDWRTRTNDQ